SFRFYLTVDTLVLSSWFRLLRPIADFHHLANTHAGRTSNKERAKKLLSPFFILSIRAVVHRLRLIKAKERMIKP
ncbi:hypothetical protein, partial [Limosilactobacillus reuteri]|uniref:hypothetical protein n=1 Tax=Limosilactobacillus reuteri TaxID=1598 RepID=UPI0019580375